MNLLDNIYYDFKDHLFTKEDLNMLRYINKIQQQLIEKYNYPKGDNGCPQNVPDGVYPMIIDDKLDLVLVKNDYINCGNFIGTKEGLEKFQKNNSYKN